MQHVCRAKLAHRSARSRGWRSDVRARAAAWSTIAALSSLPLSAAADSPAPAAPVPPQMDRPPPRAHAVAGPPAPAAPAKMARRPASPPAKVLKSKTQPPDRAGRELKLA